MVACDRDNNAIGIVAEVDYRVFACGDISFYSCILGRENMSGKWCNYCNKKNTEWKGMMNVCPSCMWSIQRFKDKHDDGLKGADRCGQVEYPIWDKLEPIYFLFPVLHVEIGLVNDTMDWIYGWIDECIENFSEEEIAIRSKLIAAEVAIVDDCNRTIKKQKQLRKVVKKKITSEKKNYKEIRKERNRSWW